MLNAHFVDSLVYGMRKPKAEIISKWPPGTRIIETDSGPIRARDTGGSDPIVIMVPDGPNVIEHYDELIRDLSPFARIICFDMPGFGFSYPKSGYDHSLQNGAKAIVSVMDALNIPRATLAFTCANGFYALTAATQFPGRVERLVLCQTPSISAMHRWTERVVPKLIRAPVIGQTAMLVGKRKAALGWYNIALPKETAREPYKQVAAHALETGSCFCLAGVVQGLMKETVLQKMDARIPITLVWGSLDRSHKYTKAESLLDEMPHTHIQLFDDCGHFPDVEQPKRFAGLLRNECRL